MKLLRASTLSLFNCFQFNLIAQFQLVYIYTYVLYVVVSSMGRNRLAELKLDWSQVYRIQSMSDGGLDHIVEKFSRVRMN